jgi:hypothetical protein
MRDCPYCGYSNTPESGFCGECGRRLPSGRPCPGCGFTSNPTQAAFCVQCGVSLRRRSTTPLIWVGGVAAVLLVTSVILWQTGVVRKRTAEVSPTLSAPTTPSDPIEVTPSDLIETTPTNSLLSTMQPEYTLQPTHAQLPTPTDTPTPSMPVTSPSGCPGAPPQRVHPGDGVYVCTQSERLVLRMQPGRDSSQIALLDPGTHLTVVGGPRCADDWSWWQVQTDVGETGWVAEGGDDVDPYFICLLETTPTPPSEAGVAYQPISLRAIANASLGFESPPTGNVTLGGIPFYLTSEMFTSQASSSPHNSYPTSVVVSVDVPRVFRVHLLLDTGNGFTRFDGKVIGQVVAHCDGVTVPVTELRLGQHVREWHSDRNVVSTASDARQVWSGPLAGSPNLTGQIDMLSLDLPATCHSGRLAALEIVDSSADTVGSLDPALNLVGATAEYISTESQ